MSDRTQENPKNPTEKEASNEKKIEDSDASPPGLPDNLGHSFRAGQIIKAMISGATNAVVREGIEYIIKHHGG
ncbi:hypothetical protein [Marmoricola sp. Leaf446]|uniref:hypothetical protein n=1 Tax=Marmoricola sp. Leaf446 TaxID=1736379 RepID=UPI0012E3B29B|nr:hypothetical protein [Marmoricola sp. Leaf446]